MLQIFLGSLIYLLYVTYAQHNICASCIEVKYPDDPKYWKLAEEAMNEYLVTHPLPAYKVFSVERATEQTDEGLITRLDFTIVPAEFILGADKRCLSLIWEKPWENFKDIQVSCRRLVRPK